MTLIVPPEPAWISTLAPAQARVLRAFLAAGPQSSSFWCGPGGVTPGAPGVIFPTGLDLRSFALTTEVVADSGGLPARLRLTSGTLVDQPASLFSSPNGRCFEISRGFGFGVHGLVVSPPTPPMRGAIFFGTGIIGEDTVRTARATGFAYDLGVRSVGDVADTAQWYAQTRADTGPAPMTRIPLGASGMTLTGGEIYSAWILAERGVRAIHCIMHRHDTNQAVGHVFTDLDGLPAAGVFGYVEVGTSGGTADDEPLVPRTTEICEVRGFTRDFMGAAA